MSDNIILVLDVETTGLDPRRHEIIDIWAVALDAKDLSFRWQSGGRVMPTRIWTASHHALKINRFDSSEWEKSGARKIDAVLIEIIERLCSCEVYMCGHNVQFDVRFVGQCVSQFWHHRLIDTASLAIKDKLAGRLDSRSLASLVSYYIPSYVSSAHWRPEQRHCSSADARITAAVLRSQLYPLKHWDRSWEKAVWPDEEQSPQVWPRVHFWAEKNRIV